MKTVVISGGSDGIGASLAMHFLKRGERVIVIGHSAQKGERLKVEALAFSSASQLTFLQADLSIIKENRHVVRELAKMTDKIDLLILCANKFNQTRQITQDNLEYTFGLYFLSRYLLVFGLQDQLKMAIDPLIVSIGGAGMNGRVNWNDLQSAEEYHGFQTTLQASQLNDLLGLAFTTHVDKVNFMLFNPIFVKTNGLINGYKNPLIRSIIRVAASLFAKSTEETTATIAELINQPIAARLSIYKQRKKVSTLLLKDGDGTRLMNQVKYILK